MEFKEVEKDYDKIVEEARASGEIGTAKGAAERRKNPRLKVRSPKLWLNTGVQVSPLDISRSGVAFEANYPFTAGEEIHISLGKAVSINGRVVSCQMVDSPTQYNDAIFRIQCEFADEHRGMTMVVKSRNPKAKSA